MKKDLNVQTCKFVGITDIIPKCWDGWFYCAISENAPFSWGDNNRTMVDAHSLADHVSNVLDIQSEEESLENEIEEYRDAFFDTLNYLANKKIYVDLEN